MATGLQARKKKVAGVCRLRAAAGQATPGPPLGPVLGQRGINIMEFCRVFNDGTRSLEKGVPVTAVVTYYEDKSFTFVVKSPPVSHSILKSVGVAKGAAAAGRGKAHAVLTVKQARDIARAKLADLNTSDEEAALRSVTGSARSMGIVVEG